MTGRSFEHRRPAMTERILSALTHEDRVVSYHMPDEVVSARRPERQSKRGGCQPNFTSVPGVVRGPVDHARSATCQLPGINRSSRSSSPLMALLRASARFVFMPVALPPG